ncbi:heterokaryon incompatibility protein-domain-containing protein [Xylaria digitata]|nr:heterokaryon incompatibility protein-domain-containing protein [Xylaria digitata]
MPELVESRGSRSCQSCSLVAAAIEVFWPLDSLAAVLLDFWKTGLSRRELPREALVLQPCADDDPFNDTGTRTHIEVFTTHPQSPWPWISRPRKIESQALSDSFIDLASSWLDLCLSSHSKCSLSVSPSRGWLPTRLVDVGDEKTAPKLIKSSSLMASSIGYQYVALSHCWGNLSAFELEIALEILPRTFRDVVIVVRRLARRFVWIDSLCIIQDSPEDWAHEATLMGYVYQNSAVTIVADAGENAFAGLSSSERRSEWQQRELLAGSQHYVRRFSHALYNDEREDNHPGSHGPSHDGTTWLYFGAYELGWECREWKDCECAKGFSALQEPDVDIVRRKALDFSMRLDSDGPVSLWKELVENFTNGDLSFKSDILPAMARVASVIGRKTGLTYLAGLWKENLSSMLLWAVQPERSRGGHEDYYAPSWSWASKVQMGLRLDERYGLNIEFMPMFDADGKYFNVPGFTIRDAACTYPQGNALLPPLDGYIDIEAPVAKLEISQEHASKSDCPFAFPGPEMHVQCFLADIPGDVPRTEFQECRHETMYLFLPIQGCFAVNIIPVPKAEGLLLLGLVVRPSDRVPNAFQRVGYMECICDKNLIANLPAYVEIERTIKLV